jgi:cytochrome c553
MKRRNAILVLGLAFAMALSYLSGGGEVQASNAIAKQQGLACTACHDKPGSKLLTDRGKYFEAMGTLDGYDQLADFARCTSCHVKKPGSTKLTKQGQRFAEVVKDMAGLRKWLAENHPAKQPEPP